MSNTPQKSIREVKSRKQRKPTRLRVPLSQQPLLRPLTALKEYDASWPFDIHPAIIPGKSIEDQKMNFGTDRVVFGVTAALIVAFIAWGLISTESLKEVSASALTWVVTNTGWLFNGLVSVVLLVMLWIGFSRYGRITLGVDGEKPEYSKFSWIAMMFSAGIGIGLFFFGPYEPLYYYLSPSPGMAEPETRLALHRAMAQTIFHWGLHAWALYSLLGAAVAYSAYRRGRVPLISSLFTSLFGRERMHGVPGRIIDMMAIIATLFGTATSLGIGALQIGHGLEIVTGIGKLGNAALIGIIAVLTAGFLASAVSGISRGIRWLSNINMTMAILLALFIFLAGPTLFLLNLLPAMVGQYFTDLFAMLGRGATWGPESAEFARTWTVFYWAWWASWAPFVGVFLAKISRGRTLREYVKATLLAPFAICVLAFGIFGGTAIFLRMDGRPGMDISATPQDLFFHVLANLPLNTVTPIFAMICIAIFFITTADSASIVMGILSQGGNPQPDKKITVFWGLSMMGIAIVMLLIGGKTALAGLQNLIIVSALPFAILLTFLVVAFLRDLSYDPAILRLDYAEAAIDQAVRTGVETHGEDFALSVEPTAAGEGAGAAANIDLTASSLTEWQSEAEPTDPEPAAEENSPPETVQIDAETNQTA